MSLLSPILNGFLNDNLSPEELAEAHKISVREVLDLLESDEATKILRRLAHVERLRQHVLGARARSKALATLDYLTHFDRHAKHADCDLRRRVSEAILKQTTSKAPERRAPSPHPGTPFPDLVRLRAARVAAEQEDESQSENPVHTNSHSVIPVNISSISAAHPSPLFGTLSQRTARRHPLPLFPKPFETAAKSASCMNSASCITDAQSGGSCKCGSPDDG